MNNALSYPKLVNQAADCDSFWRDTEKVHPALTNMEQHASNLKIATECNSKNGKKTEDKHSFIMILLFLFLMVKNLRSDV